MRVQPASATQATSGFAEGYPAFGWGERRFYPAILLAITKLAAMGHSVTGLIASPGTLLSFARTHRLHEPIPLVQGLALLPLRDDDIDSFIDPPQTGWVTGFNYLSDQLMERLADASAGDALLYFETEYFGGTGGQGAVVFRDGAIVLGPKAAEGDVINEALALLGVRVVRPAYDEFETVGLHRHRHTEDWLESEA